MDSAHPVPGGATDGYEDKRDKACHNCGTTRTPLWRKEAGELLCNACGIYFKSRGVHRPVELIRAQHNQASRRTSINGSGTGGESSRARAMPGQVTRKSSRKRQERVMYGDEPAEPRQPPRSHHVAAAAKVARLGTQSDAASALHQQLLAPLARHQDGGGRDAQQQPGTGVPFGYGFGFGQCHYLSPDEDPGFDPEYWNTHGGREHVAMGARGGRALRSPAATVAGASGIGGSDCASPGGGDDVQHAGGPLSPAFSIGPELSENDDGTVATFLLKMRRGRPRSLHQRSPLRPQQQQQVQQRSPLFQQECSPSGEQQVGLEGRQMQQQQKSSRSGGSLTADAHVQGAAARPEAAAAARHGVGDAAAEPSVAGQKGRAARVKAKAGEVAAARDASPFGAAAAAAAAQGSVGSGAGRERSLTGDGAHMLGEHEGGAEWARSRSPSGERQAAAPAGSSYGANGGGSPGSRREAAEGDSAAAGARGSCFGQTGDVRQAFAAEEEEAGDGAPFQAGLARLLAQPDAARLLLSLDPVQRLRLLAAAGALAPRRPPSSGGHGCFADGHGEASAVDHFGGSASPEDDEPAAAEDDLHRRQGYNRLGQPAAPWDWRQQQQQRRSVHRPWGGVPERLDPAMGQQPQRSGQVADGDGEAAHQQQLGDAADGVLGHPCGPGRPRPRAEQELAARGGAAGAERHRGVPPPMSYYAAAGDGGRDVEEASPREVQLSQQQHQNHLHHHHHQEQGWSHVGAPGHEGLADSAALPVDCGVGGGIGGGNGSRQVSACPPPPPRPPRNHKGPLLCANCGTTQTPLWRKDRETGNTMCNACGIYKQTHGIDRPVGGRNQTSLLIAKRGAVMRTMATQGGPAAAVAVAAAPAAPARLPRTGRPRGVSHAVPKQQPQPAAAILPCGAATPIPETGPGDVEVMRWGVGLAPDMRDTHLAPGWEQLLLQQQQQRADWEVAAGGSGGRGPEPSASVRPASAASTQSGETRRREAGRGSPAPAPSLACDGLPADEGRGPRSAGGGGRAGSSGSSGLEAASEDSQRQRSGLQQQPMRPQSSQPETQWKQDVCEGAAGPDGALDQRGAQQSRSWQRESSPRPQCGGAASSCAGAEATGALAAAATTTLSGTRAEDSARTSPSGGVPRPLRSGSLGAPPAGGRVWGGDQQQQPRKRSREASPEDELGPNGGDGEERLAQRPPPQRRRAACLPLLGEAGIAENEPVGNAGSDEYPQVELEKQGQMLVLLLQRQRDRECGPEERSKQQQQQQQLLLQQQQPQAHAMLLQQLLLSAEATAVAEPAEAAPAGHVSGAPAGHVSGAAPSTAVAFPQQQQQRREPPTVAVHAAPFHGRRPLGVAQEGRCPPMDGGAAGGPERPLSIRLPRPQHPALQIHVPHSVPTPPRYGHSHGHTSPPPPPPQPQPLQQPKPTPATTTVIVSGHGSQQPQCVRIHAKPLPPFQVQQLPHLRAAGVSLGHRVMQHLHHHHQQHRQPPPSYQQQQQLLKEDEPRPQVGPPSAPPECAAGLQKPQQLYGEAAAALVAQRTSPVSGSRPGSGLYLPAAHPVRVMSPPAVALGGEPGPSLAGGFAATAVGWV